ncbi:MAG TPA: hypothetical protein VK922_18255 [Gemmatimonadaceae bacterium]|nr:hypothetical protein [Gemmatimonadaceae bacterium]
MIETRRACLLGAATLVALAAAPGPGVSRQAVWQADVRIQLLEVTALRGSTAASKPGQASAAARQFTARVVVASDNDDEARGVRLDVLLPVGAGVVRLPAECRASPSAVATLTGRVTCDLGVMPVRGLREVMISTTATVSPTGARFAALVSSDTPDPVPGNNFAERGVP